MKFDQKRGVSTDITTSNSQEQFLVDMFKQLATRLKSDFNYSSQDIFELCTKEKQAPLLIPMQIFAEKLAPSEAIVKFLKEEHDLNYHDISELIKRNERGVWASYQRAKKKMSVRFEIKDSEMIPVSIFQNDKLSILECLISYLKDQRGVKGVKIAKLLDKHPANIWTIYNRAKKKLEKT